MFPSTWKLNVCYLLSSQAAVAAAASVPVTPPTSLPVTPQQAAVPAGLPNQAPIDNLPANQNVPDPAFINPDGANQNMRMNAQGGPVMEDEEDVERDWLDWVYTASRFAVFLSIVYFYSNLSRFILVMSSLLLMYLWVCLLNFLFFFPHIDYSDYLMSLLRALLLWLGL